MVDDPKYDLARRTSRAVSKLGAAGRNGSRVLAWHLLIGEDGNRSMTGKCYALLCFASGRRELRGYWVKSRAKEKGKVGLDAAIEAGEKRFERVRALAESGYFVVNRKRQHVRPVASIEWITLVEASSVFRARDGETVH